MTIRGFRWQQAENGESGNGLQDRSPPAFVANEALPLAHSNLGVYSDAAHDFRPQVTAGSGGAGFQRSHLPCGPAGYREPARLHTRDDGLCRRPRSAVQSAGEPSDLCCGAAQLQVGSSWPDAILPQADAGPALSARGDRVRTRPDETLELGTAFEPDFLHLYRAAKGKFTDNSISGFFQVLLGSRTVPVRTDPKLLRLMTIVCDCDTAKDASQLLNGLPRVH